MRVNTRGNSQLLTNRPNFLFGEPPVREGTACTFELHTGILSMRRGVCRAPASRLSRAPRRLPGLPAVPERVANRDTYHLYYNLLVHSPRWSTSPVGRTSFLSVPSQQRHQSARTLAPTLPPSPRAQVVMMAGFGGSEKVPKTKATPPSLTKGEAVARENRKLYNQLKREGGEVARVYAREKGTQRWYPVGHVRRRVVVFFNIPGWLRW